jgi:hypothetical protein
VLDELVDHRFNPPKPERLRELKRSLAVTRQRALVRIADEDTDRLRDRHPPPT